MGAVEEQRRSLTCGQLASKSRYDLARKLAAGGG